jgi:hypothetical protein
MLCITVELHGDFTLLKVEGSLREPWVGELERSWRTTCATRPAKRVRVELKDVSFVDDRGKVLLTEMAHNGAELVATGLMMNAVLQDIAPVGMSHSDE